MLHGFNETHYEALRQLLARLKDCAAHEPFSQAADMVLRLLEDKTLIDKNRFDIALEASSMSFSGATRQTVQNLRGLLKWLEDPDALAKRIDGLQAAAGSDEAVTNGVYAGTVFGLQSQLTQENPIQVKSVPYR